MGLTCEDLNNFFKLRIFFSNFFWDGDIVRILIRSEAQFPILRITTPPHLAVLIHK